MINNGYYRIQKLEESLREEREKLIKALLYHPAGSYEETRFQQGKLLKIDEIIDKLKTVLKEIV